MGVITNGGTAGQVATIALAAIGSYFGPVGTAVGWLIGSWLFGEEAEETNIIIDPGAQELPRFNQALRGATMAIMFGTNRVPPHIVWQNNWNFIRHESTDTEGGGKAGGSGGGKGGGGKTTNVSYEYKWDLIYHLGMVAQPSSLFNIWLGPEKVNPESVIPTATNANADLFGISALFVNEQFGAGAFLSYEDSFFARGFDTANISLAGEDWDHFNSVVGLPHRFPNTVYVGYQQLNLGSVSAVPQLTFEVGPGEVEITFNSAYIGQSDDSSTQTQQFIGQDINEVGGSHYYFACSAPGAGCGTVIRIETGLITDDVSSADVDTLATTAGLDPGSAYAFTSNTGGGSLGGDKVLLWGSHPGAGSRQNWAFVLCRIQTDGTLAAIGGWAARSNDIGTTITHPLRLGISADQEDGDPILLAHSNIRGALHEMQMQIIYSINEMSSEDGNPGPVIEDDTGFNIDTLTVNHASTCGGYFGEHQSHRSYDAFGWFLPHITFIPAGQPPPLGVKQTDTRFWFYIGKADIEADNDTPGATDANSLVNSEKGDHPDGFFGYIDLGDVTVALAHNEIAPVIIEDSDEQFLTPFDNISALNSAAGFADAGRDKDEVTIDDNDDYLPAPFIAEVSDDDGEGAWIMIMSKSFTGSEDLSTAGTYNKVRLFIFNSLTEVYIQQAVGAGSTFDTVSDAGSSEGNRFIYVPFDQMVVADQKNKILYEIRTQTSASAGFDEDVVVSKFGDYSIGGGSDVPVVYIIKQILVNPEFGMGIDASAIDSTTYETVLQYCIDEGFMVSTLYNRERPALQHIELLLSIYGGYLIDSGGIVKFGVQDLSLSPVRTIDNDHLLANPHGGAPVTISVSGRQQTYNKVKVNYIDRALEYKQNFVEINDEVDQDLYGIRAREFPGRFVMTEALANRIAIRTLWGNLYAKDLYDFRLGPKDADLEPGDVVTLVDSHNLALQSGQRVRLVMWEETGPMNFTVKAVKEIAYINAATLEINSSALSTQQQLLGQSRAPADFRMYELPQEFQGANPSLYVGYNQHQTAMGADLYLSADGTSFAKADHVEPYVISGIILDALPSREPGWMEENVQVYLFPDTRSTDVQTGFNIDTPVYVQTHALDDVSAEARGLGGGTVIINSEAMAYQGVTLLGQNYYRFDRLFRGWGGTHIQAHTSGDFWHKHGGGIFQKPYNEDKIGTVIHYKVVPVNFAGISYDAASVDANTYTIGGTYFKPQVQPPIRTWIESGISITASENLGGLSAKHVHSEGSAVTFTWPDAARQKGFGAAGYGLGTYGRFTTDITSHQWRVEVFSSDGTLVRSVSVDSGWFVYSADTNSTDFNGWAGAFSVKVTPYNDVGDALRSRTKSLTLFEQV